MKNLELQELEDLMRKKAFEALTSEERRIVEQELSEVDYDRWRNSILLIGEEKERSTKPETKDRLMAQFRETKPSAIHRILHYKVSSSLTAAMLLIAISITYFLIPPKVEYIEKTVQLPPITVIDTVKVFTPADTITVYVDRVKEVPTYLTKIIEVPAKAPVLPKALPGKSLADQNELKSLIVRSD